MTLLLKQRILAMYHDFHWVLVATKFFAAKLHLLYGVGVGNFGKVGVGVEIWKSWSWSQTFYLRLRNPGCHTWLMASISLVVVVQSNFCNRDFLVDHKFSMGLRSGELPGQTITFNFASWKSSSLFQMKDTGQYPRIFLHHLEMAFLSITSMNLYKFMIPSIGISEAATEKLKLPQNIVLGSFTSSLKWAGLNCSQILILINRLCFPGTKNDFHLKTALFPVFYSPIFRLFFAHSAFLPASGGRCHTVLEPL